MTTTLRDELLQVFDDVRGLVGDLGLRRYALTVRVRTWSGGRVGVGAPTNSDTALSPTPRVRTLREAEVASSGGTFRTGDFRADKITPAYALPDTVTFVGVPDTGSVIPDMLVPDAGITAGAYSVVVQIVLGGPIGTATFQVSTDGGVTFGAVQTMAATYQIPNIGIQLSLAGAFTAGNTYAFPVTCGGYTPEQLTPAPVSGQDRVYVLAGDNDDQMLCTLVGPIDFARAFGYSMVLRPRRESPST